MSDQNEAMQREWEERFEEILKALETTDEQQAVEDMRALAQEGFVRAQLELTNMYFEGNHVAKDEKEAFV